MNRYSGKEDRRKKSRINIWVEKWKEIGWYTM